MAEIVAAASDCDNGNMHIWRDTGIIELESVSKEQDGAGDLICTGLVNADMPLIKYRVGDYGRLSDKKCSCGKTLPLLEGIDGRTDDVLYSADGRYCSHIHLVLGGNLPIFEAQIIQESLSKIIVKYIPSKDFTKNTLNILEEKIISRMGNIKVIFEEVTEIPRTSRGKFRAVVCNLSEQERIQISAINEANI
jgi:phenylacetate-CoA ligase